MTDDRPSSVDPFELALRRVLHEQADVRVPKHLAEAVGRTLESSAASSRLRWPATLGTGQTRSMFAASGLGLVAVVVALLGGVLMSAVLTQRAEDVGPGTVSSPSPGVSPLTSDELLSDTISEEVAPGITRIIDDGAEHRLRGLSSIAIGPDGAVWLRSSAGYLFRLGRTGTHVSPPRVGGRGSMAFAADGTLYAFAGSRVAIVHPDVLGTGETTAGQPDQLTAVPGLPDARFDFTSMATTPGGAVWASWIRGDDFNSVESSVKRIDGKTWTEHGTADALGSVRHLGNDAYVCDMAATPKDVVWFGLCGAGGEGWGFGGLVRYDGITWTDVEPFAAGARSDLRVSDVLSLAASENGTLWALAFTNTDEALRAIADEDFTAASTPDVDPLRGLVLVRYDGQGWTGYPFGDVLPGADLLYMSATSMVVDPRGTLWLGTERTDRRGDPLPLLSFDGATSTIFPSVEGIQGLAVGPGGDIWAVTADGLFVIRPEAAAVTE